MNKKRTRRIRAGSEPRGGAVTHENNLTLATDTRNDLLEAALAYAARGWKVIPLHTPDPSHPSGCSCRRRECGSPGKHPRTMHGVKDASSDPEAIRRWWRMWPSANVGVATGSGVVVLDVDPRHGGDLELETLERKHHPIRAPVVRTGGGGLHLYMAGDLPARTGFRDGLDLKAAGGYVVAPPSLHASGQRYEWVPYHDPDSHALGRIPMWLRCLVVPPRQATPTRAATPVEDVGIRYLRAALEAECMAVATAAEGARNDTLNRAAYSLARLPFADLGAVADALAVSAVHAGLPEWEVRRTIQSAYQARGRSI